jgi:alginate O-acetyltransferase complex protein AlgI
VLFNSAIFVFLYLPIVWIGYVVAQRLPWARAGIAWLGLASVFFYGWWNPAFVPLLLASIVVNYGVGRLLDPAVWNARERSRKLLLGAAVAANLTALGYYKYANLLSSSIGSLTGLSTPVYDVLLPLGISFYTFTQIAYLVDTYSARRSEKSFSAYLLFVTFFPHLIAGPVLHHSEMMPQFLSGERGLRFALVLEGLAFFTCGLAKKVLIADSVAPAANRAFMLAESHSLGMVDSWFGALAYTTQIYFDFSGYSDMAIGLGLLFGIHLPLNFNSPYQAASIIDFWRCWHMTLSRFLRDYLYIPLGGSRHGRVTRQINLMLTMLLGGLWHGANWTFVAWGGYHGALLIGYRLGRRSWDALPAWLRRLGTFFLVVVGWVFFRSDSFTMAGALLQTMFSWPRQLAPAFTGAYLLLAVLALAAGVAHFGSNSFELRHEWRSSAAVALTVLFALCLLVIYGGPSMPFLYFQF